MIMPYYEDDLVKLYNADYRELGSMGIQADAIVTDPPYGETSLEWDRWPKGWPSNLVEVADALWCFGSFRMFMDNLDDFSPWTYSHEIVWEKHNGSGFASDKFRRVHELATLWYQGKWSDIRHEVPKVPGAVKRTVRRKERPPHMGEIAGTRYTSDDGGDLLMRSVLQVRSAHGTAIHPTQKPLGIVAPLISYSVKPGGLVVDPFSGSGTTLLAARQSGRRAIGFEIDEAYCYASATRLSNRGLDFGDWDGAA